MKKFKEIYSEIIENNILPFEDYSHSMKTVGNKMFKYVECENNCIISEDSLSRTLNFIQDKDFAILSAYRANFSKVENIVRNRKLRSVLNELKMGVHQLVGHWQEAPAGKEYTDCTKDELKDSVERSYLVVKPTDMTFDEFKSLIISLLTIDGETQDAAILKNEGGIYLVFPSGNMEKIGNTVTLGKISQAYSAHVKKSEVPFVFEGIETPVTNFGKQLYSIHNILY